MGVQVAAQVGLGHQDRQLTAPGRLDLPAVLAQRRRDPRQPEPLVHLLLGGRHDRVAGGHVEQAVLGQLQLGVHGDLPGADVVRARPGEVLQGRTPARRRHDPQVDLKPCGGGHRGLGGAAGHHPLDVGERGQRRHQRLRLVRDRQDVDVADGVLHPPQRPRVGTTLAARDRREQAGQLLGEAHRHVQPGPAPRLADDLDATQQVLLRLGAEPGQPGQPLRRDRLGQPVHRVDTQLGVEQHRPLRAERGDLGQPPYPGRHLGPQRLQLVDGAGAQVLLDLGGDRAAHVRDLPQALGAQCGQVGWIPGHRPGRPFINPDPERVAAGDRRQIRVLRQQGGDLVVDTHRAYAPSPAPLQRGGTADCEPTRSRRAHPGRREAWRRPPATLTVAGSRTCSASEAGGARPRPRRACPSRPG